MSTPIAVEYRLLSVRICYWTAGSCARSSRSNWGGAPDPPDGNQKRQDDKPTIQGMETSDASVVRQTHPLAKA